MKRLFVVVALVVGAVTAILASSETCFFDRESVDGLNKICTYSCASGKAAITIKSTQLCPLSIKR